MRDTIAARGGARVIFACAPSQDEFLAALIDRKKTGVTIDWSKVTAFHMDEYVGLPARAPQRFQHYLREHLLDHVPVGRFHGLSATPSNAATACAHYAALLREKPIDLICLGIGENGHIAFNDPPVADFADAKLVKRVALDATCRQQQVNDGCFSKLRAVPRFAVTLTLPVFRRARRLSVVVPGPRKAAAVRATLHDPITTACPATILRRHPHATLYLDAESAALALGDAE
jgi:glucosamine-6-phosphate deaminase